MTSAASGLTATAACLAGTLGRLREAMRRPDADGERAKRPGSAALLHPCDAAPRAKELSICHRGRCWGAAAGVLRPVRAEMVGQASQTVIHSPAAGFPSIKSPPPSSLIS